MKLKESLYNEPYFHLMIEVKKAMITGTRGMPLKILL